MLNKAHLGRNLLIALILSVFILPVANAGLVEIYINKSEELTESETEFIIKSGNDLNLEIHLSGPYRIDSGDKNLSVESIYIDVYFDSDTDRRDPTSGLPQYQPVKDNELDPGYDTFVSKFSGDDTRFENYKGSIRFSIIMKNSSSDIVRDFVIIIQMEAPPSGDSGSSGFSLPSIPDEIAGVNIFIILGALVGIIILSFVTYTFVLGPEDTTADIYKPKESIDPLKKSLTGVGYDSELPSKSNLKRLEDRDDGSDDEDEPDEEEYEYEDDDEDEEFDERAMLDKLTGTETLASATDSDDEDEEPEPAPKKKTVKKKAVKKKVVRKVAPAKKETKEPEINMGKGINNITCPACEKVHHIEENTSKFICSCGRRIRV
jgi:hypothetical protein